MTFYENLQSWENSTYFKQSNNGTFYKSSSNNYDDFNIDRKRLKKIPECL